MTRRRQAIAARARALVGVRFRPQGRNAETGLDCVGLALLALALDRAPGGYAMRGGSLAALETALSNWGLRRIRKAEVGDLLVLRAAPEQLHLAITTEAGFVHAHAGLRRVVETPGQPEWPLVGIWRLRSRIWRR
jgi:lipoprotein Spr